MSEWHPLDRSLWVGRAEIAPGDRVLLLRTDDPALARWVVESAGPGGSVIALPVSWRALDALSGVAGLTLSEAVYPDPALHGPADAALLEITKGRDHMRAYLWTAAQTLEHGGRLYLAGPNEAGAKSAIKDAAALFGAAPVLGYWDNQRIAGAVRRAALDLPPGWDAPGQFQTRAVARPEGEYHLVTLPGVFSWDHLDDGTALLLDHLGVEPGMRVLDLGCGTGIIGLAAARAGAWVTMVDDNLLAVRCARASAQANGLADRCAVLPGDVIGPVRDQRFDLILSNPPFHEGVDVSVSMAARFVREAFDVLAPGGCLRLVSNRFLRYDRVLRETFGQVSTVAETGRYRVVAAVRR